MSFEASNNQIIVTDTNGATVFDTSRNMPQIIQVSQAHLVKDYYEKYYTEEYQKICDLPEVYDFIICRAQCTPQNLYGGDQWYSPSAGDNAIEVITLPNADEAVLMRWGTNAANAYQYFQGSLLLETGTQALIFTNSGRYKTSQYANRALHVYKPTWSSSLYAMFQQSTRTEWGAVSDSARVQWTIDLKVWIGKFRS